MTKKIINEVLTSATFVSGLLGLANVDLSKSAKELPKERWSEAIVVEETNRGAKISLGIWVDAEVRTKAITYEINSSFKAILRKNEIKLDKVLIYVRGVK